MHKTIIFDLDGTIADSESVFFDIVNNLAPRFGYAPIISDESSQLKKLHLRDFLLHRLGWRIILLPFILHAGRARYHALASEVPVFPGIKMVFAALREHGIRIGMVSSSEERTIRTILEANGLAVDFITESNLFGKARALKKALRRESLRAAEALYVGDEVRDVEACREAGVEIIAVTWGLNTREALENAGAETVSTREALLERLLAH
jgi:phosphoglycolate phosphatase